MGWIYKESAWIVTTLGSEVIVIEQMLHMADGRLLILVTF